MANLGIGEALIGNVGLPEVPYGKCPGDGGRMVANGGACNT